MLGLMGEQTACFPLGEDNVLDAPLRVSRRRVLKVAKDIATQLVDVSHSWNCYCIYGAT